MNATRNDDHRIEPEPPTRLNLLILGGTAWLGRRVTEQALAAGHRVTCLARGRSGVPPAGARWWQLDREAPGAFDSLGDERFDAVVELDSQPGRVRQALQALRPCCGRVLYVSSVSVYAHTDRPGEDEAAAPVPALATPDWTSPQDYGAAKVACEAAALETFGAQQTLVLRPGLIAGPGDVSDRTGYWPWRFARAAAAGQRPVLAPDVPDLGVQVIDARDLAVWLLRAVVAGTSGVFNAVGPTVSLRDHLAAAQAVAGHEGLIRWCDPAWLATQGVSCWAGPRSLPLWVPFPSHAGFGTRSNAAALAAGLNCRPLHQTLADTLAWERARQPPQPRRAGLADADEEALMAAC